jgi:peptide deformylase
MSPILLKSFLTTSPIVIITEPDERLHKVSTDYVENKSKDLVKLKEIMYKLMTDAHGIGLAAPQVGLNLNILLINILSGENFEKRQPTLMVNPKITSHSGTNSISEGCLSLPGMEVVVSRSKDVTVEFLDEYLKPQKLDLTGINSICLQHEIDHLKGILMTEYLSPESAS